MCNRSPQRFRLDVVGETALAVDLDDREPLAVFGLEGRIAPDVDLGQIEAELGVQRAHLFERALTQMTAFSVVNGYCGYG